MSDDKPKKDKLSIRQKLYVEERLKNPSKTGHEVVISAGYKPANEASGKVIASKLESNPKVQRAIRARIEKLYPDVLPKNVERLILIADSPTARDSDKIAAIKELNKMAGYYEATTTRHERADVKVNLPSFPGYKRED